MNQPFEPITAFVLLTAILVVAGLVLVMRGIVQERRNRTLGGRLAAITSGLGSVQTSRRNSAEAEANRGPFTQIGQALSKLGGKDTEEVRTLVRAAGYFSRRTLYNFLVMRLLATGAGVVVGYFGGTLVAYLHPLLPYVTAFMGGAIAFLMAKRLLVVMADKRKTQIRRELPIVLEVLALTIESGLSIDQAIRWLAALEGLQAPHTQQVLRMMVRDLDQGQSYEVALERVADRLSIDEASDIAALLNQAIVSGTDLRAPLKTFSRDFAERRFQLAREQIGKKTTSLSLIMVAFFLPVLLLLLGSPAIVSLMRALER